MSLQLKDTGEPSLPAKLLGRAKDGEKFKESYYGVTHVTDVIKDEVLARLQSNLFTKTAAYDSGWEVREADRHGYIRALKEVLELLP